MANRVDMWPAKPTPESLGRHKPATRGWVSSRGNPVGSRHTPGMMHTSGGPIVGPGTPNMPDNLQMDYWSAHKVELRIIVVY